MRAVSLPDLIIVEVLAAFLRRSPSAVRDLLRNGVLPGKKVGRRWVIERQALLRALAPANASSRQDDPPPVHVLRGGSPRGRRS